MYLRLVVSTEGNVETPLAKLGVFGLASAKTVYTKFNGKSGEGGSTNNPDESATIDISTVNFPPSLAFVALGKTPVPVILHLF